MKPGCSGRIYTRVRALRRGGVGGGDTPRVRGGEQQLEKKWKKKLLEAEEEDAGRCGGQQRVNNHNHDRQQKGNHTACSKIKSSKPQK